MLSTLTEADVRRYVQQEASSEDIQRAIDVVAKLQSGNLIECRAFNAALITVVIAQARQERSPPAAETVTEPVESGRQLMHRALQRSLRLPR